MKKDYTFRRAIAVIPARGGSKRLPRKNIRTLFGKPLLVWAIEACQVADRVSDIYVSTEDAEIAEVARRAGAKVIDRPIELANDDVWTQTVLEHAVDWLKREGVQFDTIARVQANSPQLRGYKIDEALEKLWSLGRWEVFSVDRDGIEDAALHVMHRDVVFQKAFSVYKGVVHTDYRDVHVESDIRDIERQVINRIDRDSVAWLTGREKYYAKRSPYGILQLLRNKPYFKTWVWQMRIPLGRRWDAVMAGNSDWGNFLNRPDAYLKTKNMTVLDIGAGFGMYWPLLRQFGFRKFVGVDLYDMDRNPEHYLDTAHAYVKKFCPDCETQIIMDDIRNLDNHDLLVSKFDVILNIATAATKLNATGVDDNLFQSIVTKFGSDTCYPISVEHV